MPAIGMDQGPIAFKKWLKQYAGDGPFKMTDSLEGVFKPVQYACLQRASYRGLTATGHSFGCRYGDGKLYSACIANTHCIGNVA